MPRAGPANAVDWVARYDELSAREAALTAPELDELGLAAWFLGRETERERAWDAAHDAYLAAGDTDAAITCVFWIGFTLSEDGEEIRAGAWMSRLLDLCATAGPSPHADAVVALCGAAAAFARGRPDEAVAARRARRRAGAAGGRRRPRGAGDDGTRAIARALRPRRGGLRSPGPGHARHLVRTRSATGSRVLPTAR